MALKQTHIARKRFGQHFLKDVQIIKQIIDAVHPQIDESFMEIGPGHGALTWPLLQRAGHVHAIELDRDLAARLANISNPHSQKLTLYTQDALSFDVNSLLLPDQKLRVVGNVPYNISTPLLFHLLQFTKGIKDIHFMLQKEVVDRLSASPNCKAYGRLSIMVQYHCAVTSLFTVPPQAFQPIPKVQSAVVCLTPYPTPPYPAHDLTRLQAITTQAFNQRRKTLQNCLKPYLTASDFVKLNLDPMLRPEQLCIADFVRISNYVP